MNLQHEYLTVKFDYFFVVIDDKGVAVGRFTATFFCCKEKVKHESKEYQIIH